MVNFKWQMVNVRAKERGFGLLEVVVGLSILSLSYFALSNVARQMVRVGRETSRDLVASYLLEEGVEAIRAIRDGGWTTYITPLSGTKYLTFRTSPSALWQTTDTPETIDSVYSRSFDVASVYRDINQDITTSGGMLDPNTKKFTVTVTWHGSNATTTRSVATYLTNYFND